MLSLLQLLLSVQTTYIYFSYAFLTHINFCFHPGMTAAQVSRFHEDKTNLRLADIGYGAANPSSRAISSVYNLWLKERCDRIDDMSMYSVIRKYAKENPSSTIELEVSENGFTAVLITDFMRRVHKEFKEAGDVVFVDTTCHVNEVNTAVTCLLCAGPAGAAPLGVIFTSSQEEGSYTAGTVNFVNSRLMVICKI